MILVMMAARLLGRRAGAQGLLGTLQVNTTKATSMPDWQAPFTMEDGLRAMTSQGRAVHCRGCTIQPKSDLNPYVMKLVFPLPAICD